MGGSGNESLKVCMYVVYDCVNCIVLYVFVLDPLKDKMVQLKKLSSNKVQILSITDLICPQQMSSSFIVLNL